MWVVMTPAALMLRWVLGPKVWKGGGQKKDSHTEDGGGVGSTDACVRFYKEYAIAEGDMDEDARDVLNESISLLENFILFCKKDENILRHLLALALTARNCWHGHGEDFPESAVPQIMTEAKELISDCICNTAAHKSQMKYALSAAESLLEVLGEGMSLGSEPVSTNRDSELGGKYA